MATITAIGSFISDNLLDELGLNPTWEKLRKYICAICIVISLYPFYLVFGISVECHSSYFNGTSMDKEKSASKFANIYCSHDDTLIPIRYVGCFLQVANLLVLATSFYWLHIPKVVDSFRTFDEYRSEIDKIRLSFEKLKTTLSSLLDDETTSDTQGLLHLPSTDEKNKLVELCDLLHIVSSKEDIRKCYTTRNVIVLITIGVSSSGLTAMAVCIGLIGNTFKCECNPDSCSGVLDCVVNVGDTMIVFTCAFVLGLLLQAATVFYGLYKTARATTNDSKHTSVYFMLTIWKSSQPLHSGLLENFTRYILSGGFYKEVSSNLKRRAMKGDFNLVETVEQFSDNSSSLVSESFKYLWSEDTNFDEDKYLAIIKRCKYSIQECVPLAKLLVRHNLWTLFVKLLEFVESDLDECTAEMVSVFREMCINYDAIETPAREVHRLHDDPDGINSDVRPTYDGGSVMHRAISSTSTAEKTVKVTKLLVACCNVSVIYVHWEDLDDHKTVLLEDFIEQQTGYDADVRQQLKAIVERRDFQRVAFNVSENTIQSMINRYDNLIYTYNTFGDNIPRFSTVLKRKKIRSWNKKVSEFFTLAMRNRHHNINCALLHAIYSVNPIRCLGDLHSMIPTRRVIEYAVDRFKYELADCKELAKNLAAENHWKRLVIILNNVETDLSKCSGDVIAFFTQLEIDIDSLENELVDEDSPDELPIRYSQNLLFYSCFPENASLIQPKRQPPFAVANFLLKISKPQGLYFHKGYESDLALDHAHIPDDADYYKQCKFQDFKTNMERFHKRPDDVDKIPSQRKIRLLYENYKNPPKNVLLSESAIALSLLRIRFHTWDNTVNDFANRAVQHEHWKIVTSLLSGLIVTDSAKIDSGSLDDAIHIEMPDSTDVVWECISSQRFDTPDWNSTKAIRHIIKQRQKDIDDICARFQNESSDYFRCLKAFAEEISAQLKAKTPEKLDRNNSRQSDVISRTE